MADTYQDIVRAFPHALGVWARLPGYGVRNVFGSQADAARLIGTSQATASRILSGRLTVSLAQLAQLADRRGVRLSGLLAQLERWATYGAHPCWPCEGTGWRLVDERFDRCPDCEGSGAARPPNTNLHECQAKGGDDGAP